jgi:hypothetical protein
MDVGSKDFTLGVALVGTCAVVAIVIAIIASL